MKNAKSYAELHSEVRTEEHECEADTAQLTALLEAADTLSVSRSLFIDRCKALFNAIHYLYEFGDHAAIVPLAHLGAQLCEEAEAEPDELRAAINA